MPALKLGSEEREGTLGTNVHLMVWSNVRAKTMYSALLKPRHFSFGHPLLYVCVVGAEELHTHTHTHTHTNTSSNVRVQPVLIH